MKIFITILTLLLLFISGCSTQKRMVAVDKKELPTWFSEPKKTTSKILYATGEGKNKQEAIKNALNKILSAFSVKKVKVSNYELLKSQKFSFNQYLVLIKLDKKILFNSLKKELDLKFMTIEKRQESLDDDIIQRFIVCREAKKSLVSTKNTLIIMNLLQKNFDASDYVEKIQHINDDYEKLESNITFNIETNPDAKSLEQVIFSALSSKRLQVLTEKRDSNTHLTITIKSEIKKANSYGFILARSVISIVVKDYKGTIIGSNKLNITGKSTQGYSDAKENIAVKLNKMLLQDGIEKIIGLSL